MTAKARLDVNVALNRPAYQSSTWDDSVVSYPASYANDGNHGTNLINDLCSSTLEEPNAWWAVDLGVALYVYGVKFTNRGDCCGQFVRTLFSVKFQLC